MTRDFKFFPLITKHLAPSKVEAARRVYSAMRNINLAGGRALEAHERVALLTVPAGLRPFCLLTRSVVPSLDVTQAAIRPSLMVGQTEAGHWDEKSLDFCPLTGQLNGLRGEWAPG